MTLYNLIITIVAAFLMVALGATGLRSASVVPSDLSFANTICETNDGVKYYQLKPSMLGQYKTILTPAYSITVFCNNEVSTTYRTPTHKSAID